MIAKVAPAFSAERQTRPIWRKAAPAAVWEVADGAHCSVGAKTRRLPCGIPCEKNRRPRAKGVPNERFDHHERGLGAGWNTAEQTDRAGRGAAEQGLEFFRDMPTRASSTCWRTSFPPRACHACGAARPASGLAAGSRTRTAPAQVAHGVARDARARARGRHVLRRPVRGHVAHSWQDGPRARRATSPSRRTAPTRRCATRSSRPCAPRTPSWTSSSRAGARAPMVDVRHADVSVAVRVSRRARATVASTFQARRSSAAATRAARSGQAPIAPLGPDYAAALLAAGGWYRSVRHGSPVLASVYDGAGSLLVEAAAQALDRAPGLLLRTHWASRAGAATTMSREDPGRGPRALAEAAVGARVVLLRP